MQRTVRFGLLAALLVSAGTAAAEGLGGSPASMVRQHAVAVEEQYTFTRTPAEIARLASLGKLVTIVPDSTFVLAGVSYPYARPEVSAFVRRLARDYRDSTGGTLAVTSLTRPTALQPRNAHKLSVHPAGMAVDFRIPRAAPERAFLERTLLGMEKAGLLDVTRERSPAHYHVAVFADPMLAYAARRDSIDAANPKPVVASAPAASPRNLERVAGRIGDSSDESRLPLFFSAMFVLLATASLVLHARRSAQHRR